MNQAAAAIGEALLGRYPHDREYLDLLGLLHALLRDMRSKGKSEIEAHVEQPTESVLFNAFSTVVKNRELTTFICDYVRLMILGTAKSYEIESLMDEELQTLSRDKLKPYHALSAVADGLPALGIVAAVLGVIKAMGALDQSPELLGGLIGAALVGTFVGIFVSYGIVSPISNKIKVTREKQLRLFTMVKQTLLASLNGAMPQIAIEYGRKTISFHDRPTIETLDQAILEAAPAS